MSPIRFYAGREPGDPTPEDRARRPSAGPWRSHDVTEEDDPDCGSWVVDIPDEGDSAITVSRLYFGDMETNTGRDTSNADLVAAAPDLLDCCRAMLELHESGSWGAPPGEYLRALRAAVAKATEGGRA